MSKNITGKCNCGRHEYTIPLPKEMNLCRWPLTPSLFSHQALGPSLRKDRGNQNILPTTKNMDHQSWVWAEDGEGVVWCVWIGDLVEEDQWPEDDLFESWWVQLKPIEWRSFGNWLMWMYRAVWTRRHSQPYDGELAEEYDVVGDTCEGNEVPESSQLKGRIFFTPAIQTEWEFSLLFILVITVSLDLSSYYLILCSYTSPNYMSPGVFDLILPSQWASWTSGRMNFRSGIAQHLYQHNGSK